MAQDLQSFRRARNAAIVGLVVQIIFTLVMAVTEIYSQAPAFRFAYYEFMGGLPIWVILIMLFHQHGLERAEALEAEQLARADAATAALFDEHGVDLHIAQRRLRVLYKWGLNGVSGLVSVYLISVGCYYAYGLWQWNKDGMARGIANPLLGLTVLPDANYGVLLAIAVAVFFLAFIIARYEAGMAKSGEWQLLRGGAGYLMGNFVVALLIAAGMVGVLLGNSAILAYVAVSIPGIMILLGIEIMLMLLLGAYRPRRPGEVPRPAFDSRVLGIFTSPKSLAKALGEAINYQFGFEVSRSWFYQLLGQAITPLVAFGLLVLLAMSTVVIVAPQQEALVLRSGQIQAKVGPGLHFKWPWPIGSVQIEDVGRLQEISIGSAAKGLNENKAILWTNSHSADDAKEIYMVAAPTPMDSGNDDMTNAEQNDSNDPAAKQRTPGISLVGLQLQIQYRIKDLEEYLRCSTDTRRLLRSIAESQLNAFLVTQDIDSLIGRARITGGEKMRGLIQGEADAHGLGVEVVFVGMVGVHPPSDANVATAFHEQIEVLQESQTKIERARLLKIVILTRAAGSVDQADKITAAIHDLEKSELRQPVGGDDQLGAKEAKDKDVQAREADIEELLASAQGAAAEMIYRARAYRWSRANNERAKAERFEAELAAFQKSPQLYRMRQYLEVLTDGLAKSRKYVLVSHNHLAPTMRIDLKDAGNAMENILGKSEGE